LNPASLGMNRNIITQWNDANINKNIPLQSMRSQTIPSHYDL